VYDHQPPPPFGQPGPPPGQGAIALTLKYSPLSFLLGLFKPFVAVNGHQVPLGWGRSVVPVPPGQHHVHVHVPYLLPSRIGSADLPVAVYPGQVVELEYRAPMIAFLGGSLGAPPQKYRGMGATIALLVVTLLILLCVCGGVIIAATSGADSDPVGLPVRPVPTLPTLDPLPFSPSPSTGQSSTGQSSSDPSGSDPSSAGPPEAGKPTLRDVQARSVVGPTFGSGEKTYTMDFTGWPFAFRTPGSWGCMAGKINLPEAKAWVCIDEGNPGSGQRLTVMLRPCAAPCAAAARTRMSTAWFDDGAQPRRHDDHTWYVEKARDDKGRYLLDVSHFFSTEPGGPPAWQVGVGGTAPPATRAVIQKIVNDVFSQTS
jgi:hypothetical protein